MLEEVWWIHPKIFSLTSANITVYMRQRRRWWWIFLFANFFILPTSTKKHTKFYDTMEFELGKLENLLMSLTETRDSGSQVSRRIVLTKKIAMKFKSLEIVKRCKNDWEHQKKKCTRKVIIAMRRNVSSGSQFLLRGYSMFMERKSKFNKNEIWRWIAIWYKEECAEFLNVQF